MLCEATCHSRMHDDPKWDHGGDITECMVQHSHWVRLVPVGEPDYEAAEQATRHLYATLRTPAVVHPKTFNDIITGWTRQIVDAALGIGGTDG